MIIKKFEKFKINESFTQTDEYNELLKSKSKPESFFLDSLLDVYDMSPKTKVDYYNYIIDDEGHMINTNKLEDIEDSNYRIRYIVAIILSTSSNISLDKYEKELDNISTIILSIHEMISRCSGGGLELVLNKVTGDHVSKSFIIHFDEKIDKVSVLSAFKKSREFLEDKNINVIIERHTININRIFIKNLEKFCYESGFEQSIIDSISRRFNLWSFLDVDSNRDNINYNFINDDGDEYMIATYDRSVADSFVMDEDEIDEALEWYITYREHYY